MHSVLVRLQNVFGFFTTVCFILAGLVSVSVVFSPQTPSAKIELRNVQVVKGRPHYYSSKKEEYAHIKFDLDADLSSLFTWNTKQVFLYILASYPSSSSAAASSAPPLRAVIWDLIVPSPSQQNPTSPWTYFSTSANTFSRLRDLSANTAQKEDQKRSSSSPNKKSSLASKKEKFPQGWDAEDGTPGILALRNAKSKYQITDITGKLASRGNVTLELGWNVQPWVGALGWPLKGKSGPIEIEGGEAEGGFWRWKPLKGGRSKMFDMPDLKGRAKETVVEKGKPARSGEAMPVVK